jgi:hypothetical protein
MTSKRRSLAELATATAVTDPAATAMATNSSAAATPASVATEDNAATPTVTPPPSRPATAQRGHSGRSTRGHQRPSRRAARYDELERKETRLRADQYEALTNLSRQLNRARQGRGQRITENTLIRVAVDMLLATPNLAGSDENELRESVSSELR